MFGKAEMPGWRAAMEDNACVHFQQIRVPAFKVRFSHSQRACSQYVKGLVNICKRISLVLNTHACALARRMSWLISLDYSMAMVEHIHPGAYALIICINCKVLSGHGP